jgi:hypothetical protein
MAAYIPPTQPVCLQSHLEQDMDEGFNFLDQTRSGTLDQDSEVTNLLNDRREQIRRVQSAAQEQLRQKQTSSHSTINEFLERVERSDPLANSKELAEQLQKQISHLKTTKKALTDHLVSSNDYLKKMSEHNTSMLQFLKETEKAFDMPTLPTYVQGQMIQVGRTVVSSMSGIKFSTKK